VIEHNGGAKVELKDDTVTVTAGGGITLDGTVHITGDTSIDGVLTVGQGPTTTIDKNEIKGG
jgi:triosephosphate isomerase